MTTVVAAVIEREQRILVCQRKAGGRHELKWEFPGGKVEEDETPIAALQRELREELAIEALIGNEITRYEYAYPEKTPILLIFYSVTEFSGELQNRVFEKFEWACRRDLASYDFLEGDIGFVKSLIETAPA
jgi:8-oxo-dGTP diphosphatase